ncbi:MAG: response regulator, partial [Bdellovibrionales bacterium]|nr:response regulator [Bdellovibrionales bacterium]
MSIETGGILPPKRSAATGRSPEKVSLLVVEPNPELQKMYIGFASELGYGSCELVPDHMIGLEILKERHDFSHLAFEVTTTKMPSREFLIKARKLDSHVAPIVSAANPSPGAISDLMSLGARALLPKPFNKNALEAAILSASQIEEGFEGISLPEDRACALTLLFSDLLDQVADSYRCAQKYDSAKDHFHDILLGFRGTAELRKIMAPDEEEMLLAGVLEHFTALAEGPATRLGRVRRRRQS